MRAVRDTRSLRPRFTCGQGRKTLADASDRRPAHVSWTMRVSIPILLLAASAHAQAPAVSAEDPSPHSEITLLTEVSAAMPGDAFDIAIELTLDDGWHSYWINPGDTGQPISVEWQPVPGVTIGDLAFPAPERLETEGIVSYAYYGAPVFPARVHFGDATPDVVHLVGRARWLVCEDVCLPVEAEVRTTVRRGERVASPDRPLVVAARRLTPADDSQVRVEARDLGAAEDGRRRIRVTVYGTPGARPDVFPLLPTDARREAPTTASADGVGWTTTFVTASAERFRGIVAWGEDATPVTIDAVVEGRASALGFWGALGFAFVGGLILNLMPCVFPILSIKVLGFVGGDRDAPSLRRLGYAFGAGVVVSFWVFAAALLALRATGAGLGWGFQLQSPWLVALLAALFVVLSLNLLGVVELGGALARHAGRLDTRSGPGGAFLSGVLAVVVATPCTAPFMGAALAYALAQPPPASLAVFTALGVGMALPYVLLAVFPAWTERLPRPGPWMTRLKTGLAIPLLATVAWLVWVFARQLGTGATVWLIAALVAVALAAWAWGRPSVRLAAVPALAAALVLGAVGARSEAAVGPADDGWAAYDAGELAELREAGRPVFVDVTAAWCLSCQVNERAALASDAVGAAFAAADVVLVKADWTSRDPEITAFLDRFGRAGVPLYVYFPPGGEPVLLPEVLTPGIVVEAVSG